MSIDLDHWLWKRVRPEHHSGAFRQHVRDQDSDDDVYPRGPNASPRKCQQCASLMEYDSASPGDASWYLSSSSESSPELIGLKMCKITRIVASSRFDMNGKALIFQFHLLIKYPHRRGICFVCDLASCSFFLSIFLSFFLSFFLSKPFRTLR